MFTPFLSSGIRRVCALALAASLAACGGGGNDDTVTDGGGTPPVRPADPEGAGQLQAATLLGTVAAADVKPLLSWRWVKPIEKYLAGKLAPHAHIALIGCAVAKLDFVCRHIKPHRAQSA